jgi:hypothetical protein
MVKMKKEQVERIISRELPGYRLRQASETIDSNRRTTSAAEATTPEIGQLMRKFGLGSSDESAGLRDAGLTDRSGGTSNGDSVDDEIALVEQTNAADPLSRGNRPKAKVLSANGKVIGSQG